MDFDFQAYVQRRTARSAGQGSSPKRALSYSFGRDRRVQRTLERTRFVGHALSATGRLEEKTFRGEILDKSVQATVDAHPALMAAASLAATNLGTTRPEIRVIPRMAGRASAVYPVDDVLYVVVTEATVALLAEQGLAFLVGKHIGQIDNGHVPYLATGYALEHVAEAFYGIVAKPAQIAIGAWAKLAEITSDRAGLLACGDLDVARVSMVALAALSGGISKEVDPSHYLASLAKDDRVPSALDGLAPTLAPRLQAIGIFAGSDVFAARLGRTEGQSITSVDREVEAIVKIW